MDERRFKPKGFVESHEVEAKLAHGRDGLGALPESLWETYSAFANTNGGVIFLGVREVSATEFVGVGIVNAAQVEEDFWARLTEEGAVSVNLLTAECVSRQVMENGNEVLVIEVPRASAEQRPVFIGQDVYAGTYKRDESGDYHCTPAEVEAMQAEA